MGLGKEFKEFAMKGNVVDMAVGVIISAAFGKIVTSVVKGISCRHRQGDQGVTFTDLAVSLGPGTRRQEVLLKYGNFLRVRPFSSDRRVVLFLLIRGINKLKKRIRPAPPPTPPRQEVLLQEFATCWPEAVVRRPMVAVRHLWMFGRRPSFT